MLFVLCFPIIKILVFLLSQCRNPVEKELPNWHSIAAWNVLEMAKCLSSHLSGIQGPRVHGRALKTGEDNKNKLKSETHTHTHIFLSQFLNNGRSRNVWEIVLC